MSKRSIKKIISIEYSPNENKKRLIEVLYKQLADNQDYIDNNIIMEDIEKDAMIRIIIFDTCKDENIPQILI